MCESSNKEICLQFFGMIFQLSIWPFIILSVIFTETPLFIFLAVIVYLIYIIIECCSPISKYLRNKSNSQGIYKKMSELFKTPPRIAWRCECYHYETRHYTTTNDKGEIEHHTTTEKVVTCIGSSSMTYYSSRDISGPFLLNCDEKNINQKYYIKLELNNEITFADSFTESEYQSQKDSFIATYSFKDAHLDFSEEKYIPGLDEYNLVNIGNGEPGCINFCIFVILTILSLAEFYKCYFNSKCVYQQFTIKKIISTKYNLNEPEYGIRYQNSIPSINLINKQYYFKPSEYNYINNSYKVDLPSKEEVVNANTNENKNKIKIESVNTNQINQQNCNEVVIHNKNELNNSNSEGNIPPPPAILPIEEEKSSERLNMEKKLFADNVNKGNNGTNENDSIIFVNKQINFDEIDNKQ